MLSYKSESHPFLEALASSVRIWIYEAYIDHSKISALILNCTSFESVVNFKSYVACVCVCFIMYILFYSSLTNYATSINSVLLVKWFFFTFFKVKR